MKGGLSQRWTQADKGHVPALEAFPPPLPTPPASLLILLPASLQIKQPIASAVHRLPLLITWPAPGPLSRVTLPPKLLQTTEACGLCGTVVASPLNH